MKRIDCEQGTQEWLDARLGIPTASQFHRILTPKTRKPSSQAAGYRAELVAEWLLGESLDMVNTQYMERGSELEGNAVRQFEWDHDCEVDRVGFCLTDDGRAGCSPDGLVGKYDGAEIKCFAPAKHIAALLADGPDNDHICQIQGCMFVTGRMSWTRMYFHPSFPPVYHALERDDEFCIHLSVEIDCFLDRLDEDKKKLLAMGCKPIKPRPKVDPRDGSHSPDGGPSWDEAVAAQEAKEQFVMEASS